jgi:hypothetical protein
VVMAASGRVVGWTLCRSLIGLCRRTAGLSNSFADHWSRCTF